MQMGVMHLDVQYVAVKKLKMNLERLYSVTTPNIGPIQRDYPVYIMNILDS